MEITDILAQMGGLQSMARELGVSETEAASGAEALVPAILGGFKKQARSQPAGLEGLGGLLAQLGGGGLLDNVLSPQPTDVTRGNDVLGPPPLPRRPASATGREAVAQPAPQRRGQGSPRVTLRPHAPAPLTVAFPIGRDMPCLEQSKWRHGGR